MTVTKATPADLKEILGWLEREYRKNGEGFWSNRRLIREAQPKGELWVARRDGKAVAVQVGNYAPDIVSVREKFRGQGIGNELFAATLERAQRDGIDAMFGECAPETSFQFWRKTRLRAIQRP